MYGFDVAAYLHEKFPNRFIERGDKLIGRCLFHEELRPSFAVHKYDGWYRCLACDAKGTLLSLVMHIEGLSSIRDAKEWIALQSGAFGQIYLVEDEWKLLCDFDMGEDVTKKFVNEGDFHAQLSYMKMRGLNDDTLKMFQVGFDSSKNAVIIPWFDRRGNFVTSKHRLVDEKKFWYNPPVYPGKIKTIVWGLQKVTSNNIVIVEGEIDAMTLCQMGYQAVAIGGSRMHEEQARQVYLAGVEKVIIATDNDEAGRQAAASVVQAFKRYDDVAIYEFDWSGLDDKDVNDLYNRNHEILVERLRATDIIKANDRI